MQSFTIDRLVRTTGFGNRRNTLLGCGVYEIDACAGVPGEAEDLAKGDILGEIVMDQMKVVTLIATFTLQLVDHVGHNLVILGVDGHHAAVLCDLLEDGPHVAVGYAKRV